MTWTYHQATGRMENDGELVAKGYSGAGQGRNNAGLEGMRDVGPIPRGRYAIGKPYDTTGHGPQVMALTPMGHAALGRDNFLIHGDNKTHTASQGCIILGPDVRRRIALSGDINLEVVAGDASMMSGEAWWRANEGKFPTSVKTGDLAPGFREKVDAFIAALQKAGASVIIAATLRPLQRAKLMHYSAKLASGKIKAKAVPRIEGCDIDWDHGDEKESQKQAAIMAKLFGIVFPPSLTSLHISGKAIDMAIRWSGTMKITDAKGNVVEVGSPQSGEKNLTLHKIGKGYGVHKLLTDKPHWSVNGH